MLSDSEAAFYILQSLSALKVPPAIDRKQNQPEDQILIEFVGGFPN
jgi:hypothetical protein